MLQLDSTCVGSSADMPQLQEKRSADVVHCLRDRFPRLNLLTRVDPRSVHEPGTSPTWLRFMV